MPIVRVYVPLNLAMLESLRGSGELRSAPIDGHTAPAPSSRPGLGNDEEEREYAAWSAAANDAAELAAAGHRRVIASADVDAALVRRPGDDDGDAASATGDGPAGAATAIEVDAAIALSRIASFHVDEDAGGEIADLLWYDVTELDDVIALVTD